MTGDGVLPFRRVRALLRRSIVGAMLALCIVIFSLEATGRWDRTIADANDEAGIVAMVFCIGVAVSVAAALVARVAPSRAASFLPAGHVLSGLRGSRPRLATGFASGSPAPLRI